MLKKFLSLVLTGSVTFAFFACDETSSQAPEQETPQVGSESSSSEISSSLQDSAESSSAKDAAASSSSEISAVSSSSGEFSSQDTAGQNSNGQEDPPAKLPFDTTGVEPEVYHYGPLVEDEDAAYHREIFGDKIDDAYWVLAEDNGYCYTIDEPEGELGGGYITYGPDQYIIIEQNDSLLLSDSRNCTTYDWGDCRDDEYAYTQKITVGEDSFYYGEFKSKLLLIKLTDTTITQWAVRNPSYVPPAQDTTVHGWAKSWFEEDPMVTFVGANPNSDYVDTIFIEKYNLKITDLETTWIFENETCTKLGYKAAPGITPAESCKAYIEHYNEGAKCIQRNMELPRTKFARLCRPEPFRYRQSDVWCILDADKPDESN